MEIEIINNLIKDLRKAQTILTDNEARYFVDLYYQMQEFRKTVDNQIRSIEKPTFFDEEGKKRESTEEELAAYIPEPHDNMIVMSDIVTTLETRIKVMLDVYSDHSPVGIWCKSITGIGPVIAAGLLAHIDITKCPTAGHIWSYAGLNPEQKWEKGQKRPWNAKLKVLCWKIGQSFVKVSNNPNDVYGKLYQQRKAYEQQKNENKEYSDQAARILESKKIGKTTEAYKWYSQGMLPPAHIQQRAERYATKIFLSHLHEYWYEQHYGMKPPAPYPIAILGHAHKI
jgi:hypothetical protein